MIEMLLADRELARKSGQSSAGIRATELLGKELGMFVDRSANRHSLGGRRFSELEQEEQRREAIPHHRVVDMLVHTLSFYGHEVIEQHHGVTKDGLRYFGLLSLRSPYTGYADTVGLRNSHRQDLSYRHRLRPKSSSATASPSSPIMSSGANTPPTPSATCPGLVGDLVEPLTEQREAQARTLQHYRTTDLSEELADHAIMQMYRMDVVNVQRIPEILGQWENPAHDWGEKPVGGSSKPPPTPSPGASPKTRRSPGNLHQVIDGVCQTVH